ncbi:MerR family transcriptional regulator [Azoarcus olearius]|uniref:Transcriptional regulator, MerR-family n=1 Tax=Azoarcus sp. (strain BH72) TaxID=418699 RepID=A1K7W6_AZOSB|nr:MerR family transcriptional regulator [Azoarcus olearius]CAL94921.1 transcriptional regulator, MerR-family [Azoarcus olearius]
MKKAPTGTLTLGQLCRRVGLARTSVLHYESLQLLEPSGRSSAGYRLYGEFELERLRTIRRLRDAGLALADIRTLLTPPNSSGRRKHPRPTELLEKRLLELCQEMERVREQQRLLARLLAVPDFRDGRQHYDKAAWVALLHSAGFDETAMHVWHIEFEREDPKGHAAFLNSLGLKQAEADEIRRWSQIEINVCAG